MSTPTLRDEVERLATTPQGRAYLRGAVAGLPLNPDDLDDLIGHACLRAMEHEAEFRGDCAPATYVAAILINAARLHLKREARRADREEPLADVVAAPDDTERAALARDELRRVTDAARLLPPHFGQAIGDCLVLGYRQTAAALGISASAVKSRLWKARQELRELLRK